MCVDRLGTLLPDVIAVDPPESSTHSFIIRVWLEEIASQPGRVLWRGHITHIPDGERRYVQTLGGIADFVAPYLAKMGVRFGLGWRIRHWLERRKA